MDTTCVLSDPPPHPRPSTPLELMFVRAPSSHTDSSGEPCLPAKNPRLFYWIWVSRSSFCLTTVWYLDLITWQHSIPKSPYFNRCQFPIFCKNVEPTFDISIISLRSYENTLHIIFYLVFVIKNLFHIGKARFFIVSQRLCCMAVWLDY